MFLFVFKKLLTEFFLSSIIRVYFLQSLCKDTLTLSVCGIWVSIMFQKVLLVCLKLTLLLVPSNSNISIESKFSEYEHSLKWISSGIDSRICRSLNILKTGWRWFGSCVYHNTYIPIKIIPGGEKNLHLSKHQWKVLHHSGSKVGRLITKHGKLIKEREISDLVGQVKTSH